MGRGEGLNFDELPFFSFPSLAVAGLAVSRAEEPHRFLKNTDAEATTLIEGEQWVVQMRVPW